MWKMRRGAIPTLKLKKVKYTRQDPHVNWEACYELLGLDKARDNKDCARDSAFRRH